MVNYETVLILKRISRRLSIKEDKSIIFGQILFLFCFFIVPARYCSLAQVVSSTPQNFLESQGSALHIPIKVFGLLQYSAHGAFLLPLLLSFPSFAVHRCIH